MTKGVVTSRGDAPPSGVPSGARKTRKSCFSSMMSALLLMTLMNNRTKAPLGTLIASFQEIERPLVTHCLARTARTPQLPSNLVTRGTRSPDSTPHRASPHAPRRARIALVSPNIGIFVSTIYTSSTSRIPLADTSDARAPAAKTTRARMRVRARVPVYVRRTRG